MTTRRVFLKSGFGVGGSLLLGCASADSKPPPGGADPFARGMPLGDVPFVGENEAPLEQVFNEGLDGRLYTDLSHLDSDHLIVPNSAFYIRTRMPDLLALDEPWRIRVTGAVETPRELALVDLLPNERAQGTVLLECSGNSREAAFGLLSSAEWSGVPLSEVLGSLPVLPEASRVLVSGFDRHSQPSVNAHSQPGASWVFSFADLERTGAFLATRMNHEPLPLDHGAPVRLVVPGWYGCTCIKWVDEIRLVDDDEPSTGQMQEFASRTEQAGVPELARDFLPAEVDVAAMPVRVEKWSVDGRIVHRVVGIVWGGARPARALEIRFGSGAWLPVENYSVPETTQTWSLWSTSWRPPTPGTYSIVLRVSDSDLRTRRLDRAFYLREVAIDDVG